MHSRPDEAFRWQTAAKNACIPRRHGVRWRWSRENRLGQRLAVEREQTAPGPFRLTLVVDARIRRTPPVRALVHFDFGRQVRLGEGLLQYVLLVRLLRIVVGSN